MVGIENVKSLIDTAFVFQKKTVTSKVQKKAVLRVGV